jgi:hypothetical protein
MKHSLRGHWREDFAFGAIMRRMLSDPPRNISIPAGFHCVWGDGTSIRLEEP